MTTISARRKKFGDCFLACGVAERAAIEAGYSPRYARGNAHKLVANSGIKQYMEERRKEMESAAVAHMQEINEFWTRIIRGTEKEEQGVYNADTGQVEVIQALPALKERIKASELRARVEGAFTDKLQLSGEVQIDDARARLLEKLNQGDG